MARMGKDEQGGDIPGYMWRLNRHHIVQMTTDLPSLPNLLPLTVALASNTYCYITYARASGAPRFGAVPVIIDEPECVAARNCSPSVPPDLRYNVTGNIKPV